MEENDTSSNIISSDFGLVTARLGLLLTRMRPESQPSADDSSLLLEGKKYLTHLAQLIKILKDGPTNLNSLVPHLSFLSLLIQRKGINDLNEEALAKQINNIDHLIAKQNVTTEMISELAQTFVKLSQWNAKNESIKYFSKGSGKEFRLIF